MSKAWMPLYIGDFLADTMHLNCQETGAYLRLIMHAWQHGGLIPDDDALMIRIVRCHPPHWPRLRKTLCPFFDMIKTPGSWYSKRVGLELIKTEEISNKRKAAALQMHSKCSANALQMHTQSQSHIKNVTVIASTQSKAPSRSGSNGPRAGAATIGERMGNWVWNGRIWAEAKEPFG